MSSRSKLPAVVPDISQSFSSLGVGAKRREASVHVVVGEVVEVQVVAVEERALGSRGVERVEDAGERVGIGLVEAGGGERPAAGARARKVALARVDGAAS